jgi:hypothetical protein
VKRMGASCNTCMQQSTVPHVHTAIHCASCALCVQIHGLLEVSPELQDADIQLGQLTIGETGSFEAGDRSELFEHTMQLTLNSSLLPQVEHLSAVSTMDIHGTLKLLSADLEIEDVPLRSWKATHFTETSFILELDSNPTGIVAGTQLGVVSSHGEEVVTVQSINGGGKVLLKDELNIQHGSKAIIYKLSRRIRITADGPAFMRLWNGQHHAGGGVSPLAPPSGHHHRRSILSTAREEVQQGPVGVSAAMRQSRTLLAGGEAEDTSYSDAGYSGKYIYRSSIQPDDTGTTVELHGVELKGLGVVGQLSWNAALEFVDHACAVRWPGYRKYIGLVSSTIHSTPAGCLHFTGCTGGFEVRDSCLVACMACSRSPGLRLMSACWSNRMQSV